MRDEALAAFLHDVDPNKRPHHETALSPSNMDHHRVIWRVTSDQRKPHEYTAGQPIITPLCKALLYVRACINA